MTLTFADQDQGPPRVASLGGAKLLLVIPALFLLLVALRTMVVGSPHWESVLFSRYYVQCFAALVFGIPTLRALWREVDEVEFVTVLLLGVLAGYVVGLMSPGHAASFCYAGRYMITSPRPVRIPDVFHCTTVLWGIPGVIAFWWIAILRRRLLT